MEFIWVDVAFRLGHLEVVKIRHMKVSCSICNKAMASGLRGNNLKRCQLMAIQRTLAFVTLEVDKYKCAYGGWWITISELLNMVHLNYITK